MLKKKINLMVDKEFKGLVNLVVDILGFHLFKDELGDDRVDAKVQLLNRLLSILCTGLCGLETLHQDLDKNTGSDYLFAISYQNQKLVQVEWDVHDCTIQKTYTKSVHS